MDKKSTERRLEEIRKKQVIYYALLFAEPQLWLIDILEKLGIIGDNIYLILILVSIPIWIFLLQKINPDKELKNLIKEIEENKGNND